MTDEEIVIELRAIVKTISHDSKTSLSPESTAAMLSLIDCKHALELKLIKNRTL